MQKMASSSKKIPSYHLIILTWFVEMVTVLLPFRAFSPYCLSINKLSTYASLYAPHITGENSSNTLSTFAGKQFKLCPKESEGSMACTDR
jgi:hypothetical protein